MRDHEDQKDLHLVCSQTQDMNNETNMFSSFPIHSISLNYDLDLQASNMIHTNNRCLAM